jgi:hypothetical protein
VEIEIDLEEARKYIIHPKTRRGFSVVALIGCCLLFYDYYILLTHETSMFPSDWTVGIRIFSFGTILSLIYINFDKPFTSPEIKSSQCLKCKSIMVTKQLVCQNCKATFNF